MKTGTYNLPRRFGAASLSLALAVTTFAGCGRKEEIKVYSVAKEKNGGPMMAALNAQQPDIPINDAPVSWTTPTGWKELKPTGIRLGNWQIPGKDGKMAEAMIFSFPGNTGSELDNWNRWRREVGLADAGEKDMSSEKVRIGGVDAKLYDIEGEASGSVIASLMKDGASWFFKLRGDKDVVSKAKPAFVELLKSIHFDGGGNVAAAGADPHAGLNLKGNDPHAGLNLPGATDPHAGLNIGAKIPAGLADDAASSDEPKWNIPAEWHPKAPTPMVMKAYAVSDDKGGKATVSISKLGGDGGGVLANVTRWRGQLGLPPITEDALAKVVTTFDVAGGKATLVDFTGTDAKTGNPARMIAAAVPEGDSTWFYKLMGDDSVVGKEKEAFTQFVKTVRY